MRPEKGRYCDFSWKNAWHWAQTKSMAGVFAAEGRSFGESQFGQKRYEVAHASVATRARCDRLL